MTETAGHRFEPFFIDTSRARLFAILHHPAPSTRCRGTVVLVPAFAEEMNRCRYMVAEQARRMSAHGWRVLLPDLLGTGDSEGKFAQATWDDWVADIKFCIDFVAGRGESDETLLWGIRLGAMLAMDVAKKQSSVKQLLLWQPVLKGTTVLNQLLRMRMGAAISMGRSSESTKELRERLRGGETLRIGGYDITSAMANAIETADISAGDCPHSLTVDWLEVSSSETPVMSPASRKAIDAWQIAGHQVNPHAIHDPPYWQVHERAIGVNLLDTTTSLFARHA